MKEACSWKWGWTLWSCWVGAVKVIANRAKGLLSVALQSFRSGLLCPGQHRVTAPPQVQGTRAAPAQVTGCVPGHLTARHEAPPGCSCSRWKRGQSWWRAAGLAEGCFRPGAARPTSCCADAHGVSPALCSTSRTPEATCFALATELRKVRVKPILRGCALSPTAADSTLGATGNQKKRSIMAHSRAGTALWAPAEPHPQARGLVLLPR